MEIDAPDSWAGFSLKTLNLKGKIVNKLKFKRIFINPSADMPICADDVLVVIGDNDTLKKLNSITKVTKVLVKYDRKPYK